jgi:hypothetical protein
MMRRSLQIIQSSHLVTYYYGARKSYLPTVLSFVVRIEGVMINKVSEV